MVLRVQDIGGYGGVHFLYRSNHHSAAGIYHQLRDCNGKGSSTFFTVTTSVQSVRWEGGDSRSMYAFSKIKKNDGIVRFFGGQREGVYKKSS